MNSLFYGRCVHQPRQQRLKEQESLSAYPAQSSGEVGKEGGQDARFQWVNSRNPFLPVHKR